MDLWIIRMVLFAATVISGYLVGPFGLQKSVYTLLLSGALGLLIVLVEIRVRLCSLKADKLEVRTDPVLAAKDRVDTTTLRRMT